MIVSLFCKVIPLVAVKEPATSRPPDIVTFSELSVVTILIMPVLPVASNVKAEAWLSVRVTVPVNVDELIVGDVNVLLVNV